MIFTSLFETQSCHLLSGSIKPFQEGFLTCCVYTIYSTLKAMYSTLFVLFQSYVVARAVYPSMRVMKHEADKRAWTDHPCSHHFDTSIDINGWLILYICHQSNNTTTVHHCKNSHSACYWWCGLCQRSVSPLMWLESILTLTHFFWWHAWIRYVVFAMHHFDSRK